MTTSLNNRLLLILALMLSASGVASLVILRFAIAPAFTTLEADAAATDLIRAEMAIDTQMQQLLAITGDWAPWDEPYAFAMGTNPDYIERNIQPAALQNNGIELMQYFDAAGQLLWSGFVDDRQFVDIDKLGRLGPDDPILGMLARHDSVDSVISGILMTDRGPMLLVSMPLLIDAGVGPVGGTIILGRILTPARLEDLRDHIRVPFDIIPIRAAATEVPAQLQQLTAAADNAAIQTVDESYVHSYRLLADISGDTLGVLMSRTDRDVTAIGQDAANLALTMFVAMSLVLLGVTWLIIRRDIVGRLQQLDSHIAGIRQSGDLAVRIVPERNDEIGRLGHSFNALTSDLQQARHALVEQSFRAGRADTAGDMLHNVRNAMTPLVNVTESLSGTLQDLSSLRLTQAAAELSDPECPDDRRGALLEYVAAAADQIEKVSDDAATDVSLIGQQARLVADILSGQEKIARFRPLRERINLGELVSEAAAMVRANGIIDVDLQIAPDLDDVWVMANRVHLVQVVGNVLLNAVESVARAGRSRARITVNVTEDPQQGAGFVTLSVADNGRGLDKDELTRIFQRGFTSKNEPGHGIGLHWCANAIGANGGSIACESEGPGKGAIIHIRLPAAPTSVNTVRTAR